MKEALYNIVDAIHHLQRERGCSAIFLASEGKLFSNDIQLQFTASDKSLDILSEGLERWSDLKTIKASNIHKIKDLLKKKNELIEQRGKITNQELSASQVIDFYTHQIICPLVQESIEIALFKEGSNPTLVSAFNAFLQWKERIGLERAIGARVFIGENLFNEELIQRLIFLLSEQMNYQNTFMVLANEKQKEPILDALNTTSCQQIDHYHSLFRHSPCSDELSVLTSETWFKLMTDKIDALQKIAPQLIDSLLDSEAETIEEPAALTSSVYANSALTKHALLIDSLQIFSNLPTNTFQTLMSHAQVREFQKGKLLFLEGEQANRLYIILNGWIKIFKGTAAGDEAILLMRSSGDSIMETAAYLNLTYPLSAQVVEDATLLSIPAPVVREQVKKNNNLAVNLLSSMCYRSQNLIREIEVARLKSVDERLGWFLLKLALENGRSSKFIQLPYEKSLIASYLNMKRETFSRALQRLKKKNFKIENDVIIMPSRTALCEFCDHILAENCKLHGTDDCPNPQSLIDDEIKTA